MERRAGLIVSAAITQNFTDVREKAPKEEEADELLKFRGLNPLEFIKVKSEDVS